MAHVVSIVYRPLKSGRPQDRYERVPAERVELAPFKGIVGDQKGGSTKRQLNLMRAETLAELAAEGFQTAPGQMGEQLIVAGLAPEALTEGTQLRIGGAVVEVGILRTGCARLEMIQGKPRGQAKGRLGVLATVVSGGAVAVGDEVALVPPV